MSKVQELMDASEPGNMPSPLEFREAWDAHTAPRRWRLVGIEFHGYREGGTWLDAAGGNRYLSHWGFWSLEWRR